MKTFEKIDFLMKIANISNSALAKYLTFDTSYISRIRSGKRGVPRNQPFTEPVAEFFAEHIQDTYQKKIAEDFICPGKDWPEQTHQAKQLLYEWLSQPVQENNVPVGSILSGIASAQSTDLPAAAVPPAEPVPPSEDTQFFYGNEGKRKAVALFLSELGQMEKPPRLLLYSNEEFDWLYEDPKFAQKWAVLLFSYIKKGGSIIIAHTISRASGEMLVALQKWIPIYMTGAVTPYYYPKILDRVFRRTMFIAEGHSAIIASSVGTNTENAVNIMLRDKSAVKAVETEYRNFLDMCKPLMQIFTIARREAFFDILRKFYEDCESTITVRTTPSFYTMPKATAKSMTGRLDSSWIIKRQEAGEKAFREMMRSGNSLTEVLNLSEDDILQGNLPFPMCDLYDKPGLFYTKDEFRLHLENVIRLLRENENYHVILSSAIPGNEIVYVKEDTGVIVVKSDFPSMAFVMNEPRMVAAFWDYLSEIKENKSKKNSVIEQLEALINRL